jgi:predicted TIM-barrel fold metal-dependent hydrolase
VLDHLGMNADDLEYVARLLDTYPNYYVDMSSVVQDLGRQPYSAREFFIRYQDRILFGTDGGYA